MRTPARRFLWTLVAATVVVGLGLWVLRSAIPEPPAGQGERAGEGAEGSREAGGPTEGDSARRPAGGLDLPGVDLGEGIDLAADFEAPASRRVQRWELFRDGRRAGSFRAEIAAGQEGMVELAFRLSTEEGVRRGSVTTIPRFFYRYARQAVEAEGGSALPLLTVLVPPALEAVLRVREGGRAGEAGEPEGPAGEPATVDGIGARRFTATVGEVRIETVAAPDRLLPLRVRTTLPDGTVLEARPPGTGP